MGFGSHIVSMFFGIFILISVVGGGFVVKALFDADDGEGNKRTISLSDFQLKMSKAALILYMIMSAPIIFFYFKLISKS
jgi:hypothetical protein